MRRQLIEKTNKENCNVVNQLIDLLDYYDINDIEGLIRLQDKIIQGRTIDEQIKVCMDDIYLNPYRTEDLDFLEIEYLMDLEDRLESEQNSDDKIMLILKINSLLKYDMMFPYNAYMYIINGKL